MIWVSANEMDEPKAYFTGWICYRNCGGGKRRAALGDAEQQGLFSTSAGSAESPPESPTHPALPNPGLRPRQKQCASKITEAEVVSKSCLSKITGRRRRQKVVILDGGWYSSWGFPPQTKSEREKQISYINTCMWKLEKWCRWTYLQCSNGDVDIEKRLMDTLGGGGKEEGGMNGESSMKIYTLPYVK